MNRLVQSELLDTLPPDNPDAMRSRRDLCRINAWMRHHSLMSAALQTHWNGPAPGRLIELGAGDGNFLLRVAQRAAFRRPNLNVTLLDLRNIVRPQTIAAFQALGWRAEAVAADVFDWSRTAGPVEVAVANLFLHHFENHQLAGLLGAIAGRARLFIALEPRRAAWPLFGSRCLWVIGCNRVTRHDAAISVRAGFNGSELSRLWPATDGWQLIERSAGAFSHLFIAKKTG